MSLKQFLVHTDVLKALFCFFDCQNLDKVLQFYKMMSNLRIELNENNLREWEKTNNNKGTEKYVRDKFLRGQKQNSSSGDNGQARGSEPLDSSTQVDSKAKRSSEESKDSSKSNSNSKEDNKNSAEEDEEEKDSKDSNNFQNSLQKSKLFLP
jgi:hypothetical protein